MKRIDFYFDYVSPYSYLAFRKLSTIPNDVEVSLKPIAAGAVMKANEIRFPVEISTKHAFIKRHCQWLANTRNTPFQVPSIHPFNSLSLLRLTLLAQNARGVVDDCFRFVWVEGNTPQQDQAFMQLVGRIAERVNIPAKALLEEINSEQVKADLKTATDQAIAKGIFGVPSFIFAKELYFGQDSMPMLIEKLGS